MKFNTIIARVLLASLLEFAAGIDNGTIARPPPGPPSCASRCMVDSMFMTQCLDTRCLCNQRDYQKSLFQCLFSQCDSNNYGPALSHSISLCMRLGAEIYMVAPGTVDNGLLQSREEDYLAGREVKDVPGLQLRQESIAGFGPTTTVTTTVTNFITVAYSPITVTPITSVLVQDTQAAEITATSASRPWIVPLSPAARSQPSFFGLVIWISLVLALDYWKSGY
ncbi:hypothetical protein F4818DRAFT_444101 [Hypoxylon cercidicola]|nr:hypothetical protein F4818DRAFT_444101 [Hypoxylon cercidicola]